MYLQQRRVWCGEPLRTQNIGQTVSQLKNQGPMSWWMVIIALFVVFVVAFFASHFARCHVLRFGWCRVFQRVVGDYDLCCKVPRCSWSGDNGMREMKEEEEVIE